MESTEELQALSASRRAQRDRLKTYSPQVVDQLLRDSPAATQRNQADFSESLEWHQVRAVRPIIAGTASSRDGAQQPNPEAAVATATMTVCSPWSCWYRSLLSSQVDHLRGSSAPGG